MRHADPALALVAACLLATPPPVHAAESYDSCSGFIQTLPAVIDQQGTWCLRAELGTNIESGNAISVTTNNVTIDCNGFKLGNLQASDDNAATGIHADGRNSVVVRGCNIRGFGVGLALGGEGHRVEGNGVRYARQTGIVVSGSRNIVRDNHVVETIAAGSATGISAAGEADITGNIVDGVLGGQGEAVGIVVSTHQNTVVRGNTVRGVLGAFGTASHGIRVADTLTHALVADNYLGGVSSAVGFGVHCSDDDVVVRDNTIVGFQTPMNCTDSGGNVAP